MSFTDYFLLIMYILILIEVLVVVIWRITCFFKKSCKWKNCPYRQNYHITLPFGWSEIGCKKFPPTQEEIDEQERLLDQADALIEQLKEENSHSEHNPD